MIIKCHCCKTECPSIQRWHRHLISNVHRSAVTKDASDDDDMEESNKKGNSIFLLLQPMSDPSSAPGLRDLEAVTKLSSYGFVHDFYSHSDGTNVMMAVNLELGQGITQEFVLADWNRFDSLAPPHIAPTPHGWNQVISCLNSTTVHDLVVNSSDAEYGGRDNGYPGFNDVPLLSKQQTVQQPSSNEDKLSAEPSIPIPTNRLKITRMTVPELNAAFCEPSLDTFQLQRRETTLENIASCISDLFSTCQLQFHPFGSFLTGIGDKGSDLDVTMTGHENLKICGTQLAKKLRKALRKHPAFTTVQLMIMPSVEVLRFTDALTGISCDLSFNNLLAVRNSELIAFILTLDPRIPQLVAFVRRWGNFYKLTGGTKLKNYTLVLLVLVFLARKKFIPNIWTLQSSGEEEVIDGLNAGFNRDAHAVRSMASQARGVHDSRYYEVATLLQLTQDFFSFFANENFEKNAICTLTAECIPKAFLHSIKDNCPILCERLEQRERTTGKPNCLSLKKKPLIVLDPFNPESNVGISVSKKHYKMMMQVVAKTAEYFSTVSEDDEVQLFPTVSVPPETSNGCEEGALYADIVETISPVLEKMEDGRLLLEEIEDDGCKKIVFKIEEDFSRAFYEADLPGDRDGLWCVFAKLFIFRAWTQSYLLQVEHNVILEGTKEEEEGVIFCNHLHIHGPQFPAGALFQLRQEQRNEMEEAKGTTLLNPFDEERAIRVKCLNGGGGRKPELAIKCLAALFIDKELGPHCVLFLPKQKASDKNVKNMISFVTTGIKKSFPKYQLHLLGKWIANGQNSNVL